MLGFIPLLVSWSELLRFQWPPKEADGGGTYHTGNYSYLANHQFSNISRRLLLSYCLRKTPAQLLILRRCDVSRSFVILNISLLCQLFYTQLHKNINIYIHFDSGSLFVLTFNSFSGFLAKFKFLLTSFKHAYLPKRLYMLSW